MEKAKKFFGHIFLLDIWKLPKQADGSIIGLLCTCFYPILSFLILLFFTLLLLLPALGGNIEKNRISFIKASVTDTLQNSLELSLTSVSHPPAIIYTKERNNNQYTILDDPCTIKPTLINTSSDILNFKFCQKMDYLIFINTNQPFIAYENGIIYGDLYQKNDIKTDAIHAKLIGNKKNR